MPVLQISSMYEILKKKKIPTDRPISEKQGRERGNKNIFKVGLIDTVDSEMFART